MRIAVVGLGGVGAYYGGKLALEYAAAKQHDILFVCRGKHLERIRRDGLKVITPDTEFTAMPALATDNPEELGAVDIIFFCVKGYDLESAARMMSGTVRTDTVIIPLANGVDNAEMLRSVLPAGIILNGCVYISTHIVEPGLIEQTGGSCKLFFGAESGDVERYRPIETVLKNAGIKAELTASITAEVWAKYIFVGPVAGVTSMLDRRFGEILENEENSEMLRGMMEEVAVIARRRGIALPGDIVTQSLEKAAGFPYDTKSSMQLDYERGKRAELETFVGYVVRSGEELSVPTPLHQRVYAELSQRTEKEES